MINEYPVQVLLAIVSIVGLGVGVASAILFTLFYLIDQFASQRVTHTSRWYISREHYEFMRFYNTMKRIQNNTDKGVK